jgi:hypothetical protein
MMKDNQEGSGIIEGAVGAWRVGDAGHTIFGAPNGNPSPEVIATLHKGGYKARHMIASAPEMLETMKAVREGLQLDVDREDLISLLEESILKAQGR